MAKVEHSFAKPEACKTECAMRNRLVYKENKEDTQTQYYFYGNLLFTVRVQLEGVVQQCLLGIRIIKVQSHGYPVKRKPVIMRTKHVWFMERLRVENSATIRIEIKKQRDSCAW